MSDLLNSELYYRITDLPAAGNITGNEVVEAVQDGVNVKFTLAQLLVAGKSAYDIAIEEGFIGSELDWLKSLVGSSAYDIAIKNGFVGTQSDWLLTLVGLKGEDGQSGMDGDSAYKTAVKHGFPGTEAEWLQSLIGKNGADGTNGRDGTNGKDGINGQDGTNGSDGEDGLDGKDGADGKSVYEIAVTHGFMGTEAQFAAAMTGKTAKGGAVFVTAVTAQNPADNVGEFAYTDDGVAVVNCASTTRDVTIKVLALTGFSRFRPKVTVNGSPVTMAAKADAPLFEGTINVTLDAMGIVSVKHEDGAEWTIRVREDAAPLIESASFNGGYPVGQTELKAGDKFSILLSTDIDVDGYEIEDSGAFVASSGSFITGKNAIINDLVIADRGVETIAVGFRLRVKKPSGAWSEWFDSAMAGDINGVNTVKLNNQFPIITFDSVVYPEGQAGLKENEIATVNHTVTNFDTIQYSSTELTIEGPVAYAAAKNVMRNAGSYNATAKNFTVKATRTANGAISEDGIVVAIANVAPTIIVTTPAARLRSGGNAGTAVQNHVITITSSQVLAEPPTLNAPEGTWAGVGFVPNADKKVWTRTLRVHDDNAKGTFSWNSLQAKSLSGMVQDQIGIGAEYTLGGFVFRTLTVPAFPNRSAAIGTHVANTAKLRSTNLSKGASGSLNSVYQADKTETANRYTVVTEAGIVDAAGNHWYNADGSNASSNTGGTMKIEIEEVV